LLLAFGNIAGAIIQHLNNDGLPASQIRLLTIAPLQAFLFTASLVVLIKPHLNWNKILPYFLYAVVLTIAIPTVWNFFKDTDLNMAQYIFSGLTLLLYAHYTQVFMRYKKGFSLPFFSTLAIGVGAVVSSFFYNNALVLMVFTVLALAFYSYFAIYFINYASSANFTLPKNEETIEAELVETPTTITEDNTSHVAEKIEKWIDDKHYCEPNITSGSLSSQLNITSKELIAYFKQKEQKTFPIWLAELRIAEAKRLLAENPKATIADIAMKSGFADRETFHRSFVKIARQTPSAFRKSL
jgi:AraC-like DNA-binding protein